MLKQHSKFHLLLVISTIAISICSKINCYNNFIWWLEALPVLIALPILFITYNKFRFTNLSYFLIWIHFIILLIGAHYTYERVPLFDHLKDIFQFTRNNYDRIGHFAQGFVPAIIARELLIRTSSLKQSKWLVALVIFSILGISALYEIFEWIVAITSGESASGFLALQGDVWDTQKDMFLAGIGAILALIFFSKIHDKQLALCNKV